MNYILYIATSPSGRSYIGVTKDFKRRLKEHGTSKYAFGHAIRKYGKLNFNYAFEFFNTIEEALHRESQLVTLESIQSRKLYNETVGGALSNVLIGDNPMHREDIKNSHPNLWTTENNPMKSPNSKERMIKSQKRKKVSIDGTVYEGIREACRQLGTYRQFMIHRLRSSNYPSWYYV